MGGHLKKLGDFNEVIEYYQDVLKYVSNCTPRGQFNAKPPSKTVAYDRAIINNIAISVAQNFEFIEEHNLSNIDDIILAELEDFSKDINCPEFGESFKAIMTENGLTPFNTLKQIRNALLHGDYEIELVTPSDFNIFRNVDTGLNEIQLINGAKLTLNGQSIKASLEHPLSIHLIECFFECVRLNRFPSKNIEFVLGKSRYQTCKSRQELEKFIGSYSIFEIVSVGSEEKSNRKEIIGELIDFIKEKYPEHIPNMREPLWDLMKNIALCEMVLGKNKFELRILDKERLDERRNFIKSYIEYLGLGTWQNMYRMHPTISNTVYTDFYASTYGHTSFSGISNRCCKAIRDYNVGLMKGQKMGDIPGLKMQYAIMLHETPITYANLMLAMLNYSCGYLKENNSNEGSNLFDYHDLGELSTLTPTIDVAGSIKRGVDSKDIKQSIDTQVLNLEKQKKNIEKSIEKISKNINDKNPKKAKFEEDKRREEERLAEIEQRINGLKIRKDGYGESYDDYSEFFRHMRNSIAHGRYQIDYSKAFKTKDFSKIKFTFRDYEPDDKENPSFEITLTAKQIHRIVNCVKNKVNHQTQLEGSDVNISKTRLKEYLPAEELLNIAKAKGKKTEDYDDR